MKSRCISMQVEDNRCARSGSRQFLCVSEAQSPFVALTHRVWHGTLDPARCVLRWGWSPSFSTLQDAARASISRAKKGPPTFSCFKGAFRREAQQIWDHFCLFRNFFFVTQDAYWRSWRRTSAFSHLLLRLRNQPDPLSGLPMCRSLLMGFLLPLHLCTHMDFPAWDIKADRGIKKRLLCVLLCFFFEVRKTARCSTALSFSSLWFPASSRCVLSCLRRARIRRARILAIYLGPTRLPQSKVSAKGFLAFSNLFRSSHLPLRLGFASVSAFVVGHTLYRVYWAQVLIQHVRLMWKLTKGAERRRKRFLLLLDT